MNSSNLNSAKFARKLVKILQYLNKILPVRHFGRIGMCVAGKSHAFQFLNGAVVHADGHMGRILHHEFDSNRIGKGFGRILCLARDIFIVMRFLHRQCQGRNSRHPFGVFNLLRFRSNAFRNCAAIAVQPSELEKSNFLVSSLSEERHGGKNGQLMVSIGCQSSVKNRIMTKGAGEEQTAHRFPIVKLLTTGWD